MGLRRMGLWRCRAKPDDSYRQLQQLRAQLLEVGRVIGQLEIVADHLESVVNRHWPASTERTPHDA